MHYPIRKMAILGVVLFVTPACQRSNPARPSPFIPPVVVEPAPSAPTLIGLSGTFVGMANEICDSGMAGAIDMLKVDFEASGRSLTGALLMTCPEDDCAGGTALGLIADCPVPPNPCEAGLPPAVSEGAGSACLTGDAHGSGSLQVYAIRATDADPSWHVGAYFPESGDYSNTVSGTVEQPQVVIPENSSMDSARFIHR